MCSLPGEAAAEFGSNLTKEKAKKAFPGPGGCFPLRMSAAFLKAGPSRQG